MRMRFAAGVLLCGLALQGDGRAQAVDPNLEREVAAVRAEVAHSRATLRRYTWTESTEVSVKGEVKSSTQVACIYDTNGELKRTPVGPDKDNEPPNVVAKRHINRKKGEMQDYIDRSISMVHKYLPPKPEQLLYLLEHGRASFGPSKPGTSAVVFKNYYLDEDSLTFIYDAASKRLLHVTISTNLANPKDPVTLEADFETLPDGVNHLATAILSATAKKVQVKVSNASYQLLSN